MQTRGKHGARRARSDARGLGPRAVRGIQIGPRIRVGGTLGKIGQQAKLGIGKVAKKAAPFVSFVNPAAGAILAGAGTALDTSNGRVGLGDIAMAGAKNYGLGKLGSAVKMIPGASKIGGMVDKIPGMDRIAQLGGKVKSVYNTAKDALPDSIQSRLGPLLSGAGGDGKGSFGAVGDFLGQHGDKLLMGGAVASSYLDQKANRELRERALKYATDSFDARAPLRERGIAGALDPERPDLSGIFTNAGNVYARPGRVG